MRWFRGRVAPLVVLVLGLSACQSGAPAAHAPGGPSVSPGTAVTADAGRCARLAKRGFTPCPPTADRLQLPPTTIRNATNGAISDATAQQWGRAFQLTEAYYRWALEANSRAALTAGALSDASPEALTNLFGNDLRQLDDATVKHGVLIVQPLQLSTTQVVIIPSDLQDAMRRQGLGPTLYGLAVRFVGPSRRSMRFQDGRETQITSSDATFSATLLIWGEQELDQDLGLIWFEHGTYGCDGSVRNVCNL